MTDARSRGYPAGMKTGAWGERAPRTGVLALVALALACGGDDDAARPDGGIDTGGEDAGAEDAGERRDAGTDASFPVGRPDASVPGPCERYGAGVRVFDVDERHPPEISGLAISRGNPGVLWVHDDGGNPAVLVALSFAGEVVARIHLAAPLVYPPFPLDEAAFQFNNDWEDLALGPCAEGSDTDCLYVADFGDNDAGKQDNPGFHYTVFRVPEPELDPVLEPSGEVDELTSEDWVGFPFRYADRAHDAEGLAVDPSGRPIVFTKEREEDATRVFRFGPLPETAPRTFAPVEELERMASLTLTDESLDLATGADLNRSADRLALRTYRHVYEYRFAAFPEGLEALSDADLVPGVVPDLDFPRESPQGEAVAYDPFTGHLLTISEHVRGIGIPSLHELPCAE